jgi:hypothetical protein
MSAPETPGPAEPEPPKGSALLLLVGIVLLLPGICAVYSALGLVPMFWNEPSAIVPLAALWVVCGLIAYGGIKLIGRSTRR